MFELFAHPFFVAPDRILLFCANRRVEFTPLVPSLRRAVKEELAEPTVEYSSAPRIDDAAVGIKPCVDPFGRVEVFHLGDNYEPAEFRVESKDFRLCPHGSTVNSSDRKSV